MNKIKKYIKRIVDILERQEWDVKIEDEKLIYKKVFPGNYEWVSSVNIIKDADRFIKLMYNKTGDYWQHSNDAYWISDKLEKFKKFFLPYYDYKDINDIDDLSTFLINYDFYLSNFYKRKDKTSFHLYNCRVSSRLHRFEFNNYDPEYKKVEAVINYLKNYDSKMFAELFCSRNEKELENYQYMYNNNRITVFEFKEICEKIGEI